MIQSMAYLSLPSYLKIGIALKLYLKPHSNAIDDVIVMSLNNSIGYIEMQAAFGFHLIASWPTYLTMSGR